MQKFRQIIAYILVKRNSHSFNGLLQNKPAKAALLKKQIRSKLELFLENLIFVIVKREVYRIYRLNCNPHVPKLFAQHLKKSIKITFILNFNFFICNEKKKRIPNENK